MIREILSKSFATIVILCLALPGPASVVANFWDRGVIQRSLQQDSLTFKEVLPLADIFNPIKEKDLVVYYQALNRKGRLLGYVFKALGRGYSSDIVTLVGMDKEGVIQHIKIISLEETPGIGTRVVDEKRELTGIDYLMSRLKGRSTSRSWFQVQFEGKKIETLKNSVDAITGATITSRAVIDSVAKKAKEIMKKVKHGA